MNGYQRLHRDGLSSVTIDNTQNDSDVFAKLVYLGGADPLAVRVFFLKGKDQFTLSRVRAGEYDLRYRDLDSGAISKSQPFELKETRLADGIEYSRYTMTLYKVRDGNMHMQSITEDEF